MKSWRALASGAVGACALTLIHETARRIVPEAPRADVLGMRAIGKVMRRGDVEPPPDDTLHTWALAGDLAANSLYYSLVGSGPEAWLRGALLGLGAGVGAVVLPGPLGLGEGPSGRTTATKVMTIAWYLAGGLFAAAATRLFRPRRG